MVREICKPHRTVWGQFKEKVGVHMYGLNLDALLVTNTPHGDEGKETLCEGQTARHRSDIGKAVFQMFYEPDV